jgi:hypothetical protein
MLPKFAKHKIRIWAIMLKNFHINSPNGRLAPHLAHGRWEGYVETFPYNQELGKKPQVASQVNVRSHSPSPIRLRNDLALFFNHLP